MRNSRCAVASEGWNGRSDTEYLRPSTSGIRANSTQTKLHSSLLRKNPVHILSLFITRTTFRGHSGFDYHLWARAMRQWSFLTFSNFGVDW